MCRLSRVAAICCGLVFEMILDQLLSAASARDINLAATDDETKVLEEATDLVLEITLDLD